LILDSEKDTLHTLVERSRVEQTPGNDAQTMFLEVSDGK